MDIIALLLSRRKHLKLEQLIDKEKYIPDIEARLKARGGFLPQPIVKFEASKKKPQSDSEQSSSSSDINTDEEETAGSS